jgi:hypothetical protein
MRIAETYPDLPCGPLPGERLQLINILLKRPFLASPLALPGQACGLIFPCTHVLQTGTESSGLNFGAHVE